MGCARSQPEPAGPEPAPVAVEGATPHEHGHEHDKHGHDKHEHEQHGHEQHGHEQHGHGHDKHAHEHDKHAHGHDKHAHGHGEAKHGDGGPAPLGHRFEKADDWVARFDDPARDRWQKPADVIAAMAVTKGMVVADIGAGTGYFLPHLSRAVGPDGKVLALDIEPDMVRYMTERAAREGLANVEARVVETDDPGLAEGTMDRVLLVNTWHHIPERRSYAEKLARSLRPGGAVYVVDYTLESKRGPPRAHRMAPQVVAGELEGAGLKVSVVREKLPNQYILAARKAR